MKRSLLVEKLSISFVLVATIIALIFRFVWLSSNPPGFYLDEASIAINAWSIAQAGIDEHEVSWPVYFKAFGEYKNPVYIYSQALVFLVSGFSVYASRLTSALWGVAFAFFLGIFGFQVSKSKTVGLVALLLALTNPWHFLLSRIVFEVISLPTILIGGIILLYQYHTTKKKVWWYWFCVSMGVLFYTYTAARLLAPFFVGLAILLWIKDLKFHLLGGLSLFLISLLPAVSWEHNNPGSLIYAFNRVSGGLSEPLKLMTETLTHYPSHFTDAFLFGVGDTFLRHTLGYHSGILWVTTPLLVLGLLLVLTRMIKNRFDIFLLFGLLVSPAPSAVTVQSPHALRAISLLVFLLVFMVVGLSFLFKKLGNRGLLLVSLLIAIESVFVFQYFQSSYKSNAEVWFNTDLVELYRHAQMLDQPYTLSSTFEKEAYVVWAQVSYEKNATPFRSVGELTQAINQRPLNTFDLKNGTNIFSQEECVELRPMPGTRIAYENLLGCVIQK